MDDVVVTRSNEDFMQQIIYRMGHEFSLRRLGYLKFFLQIQVCREEARIHQSLSTKLLSEHFEEKKFLYQLEIPLPLSVF